MVVDMKTAVKRSWYRLLLSLFGISIIAANWRWAVQHLYTLPDHSIAAFTSITNNAHYMIGFIVIFAVTGKTITDWKSQTASSLISRTVQPEDHFKGGDERLQSPKYTKEQPPEA